MQIPPWDGRADDQGGIRTREITLRRKDGTLATFLDTSRAVWDTAGKIVRYQGTLVDVTERREMEKALRRQEEFQRDLLESFPDLILVIDLRRALQLCELDGFATCWATRRKIWLRKKVESREGLFRRTADAVSRDLIAGRQHFGTCECGARHRDGSWRTMRASASPLFDAEKKAERRDRFGARHHGGKETGAADHPERAPGRHGTDDRRLCP